MAAKDSPFQTPEKKTLKDQLEIHIPSDPRFLKIIRMAVSHLCELLGFPVEEQKSTVLAVDEACTNIIKHAYLSDPHQVIEIRFHLLENGLQVILRDYGRKADLKQMKSRELNDVRPGGIGIHLIKSVMDVVRYDNTLETGNELTLIKYLRPK